MSQDSDTGPVLAFELQARYAPGETWITLDVCSSRMVAVEEALFHRDAWGRAPAEVRVLAVHGERRAA
ncbi:MAG TPA: hypothetical protein VFX13_19405 [Gaiellales bacterium]|jgi:hypothetical protein|nr:hypothetical protein [Gaiellales bacterium]